MSYLPQHENIRTDKELDQEPHFSHMINKHLMTASKVFSAGVGDHSYASWLNDIWQAARPVVSQLYRSHYVE